MTTDRSWDIYLRETLRYLGYGGIPVEEIDLRVLTFIEEITAELREKSNMKNRAIWMPLSQTEDRICFGEHIKIRSRDLSCHLAGCEEGILFAATLGTEADRIIYRYSRMDMSKGVIAEAAATALIEAYCDDCQAGWEETARKQGRTLRERFSPGYGDFSIVYQKDILALLDAARKLGLTLTDGLMLAPAKSVTAIIGISDRKASYKKTGCQNCDKKDCAFRREM